MINPISDVNSRLADEKEQRLKRIKLIERETAEQAPIWQQKQMTLYPTAVPISQTPTLGQVITEETQRNAMNSDVLYQRAEQKLKQIADNSNVEYILDRLDDTELYYLVNSWDGILKELKEKFVSTGLDKNLFISMVKNNASNMDMNLSGFSNDLTEKGKLRQQQKEQANIEKQAELDAQKEKDRIEAHNLGKSVIQKENARKTKVRKENRQIAKAQQHDREEVKKTMNDMLNKVSGENEDEENQIPSLSRNAKKHQKYISRHAGDEELHARRYNRKYMSLEDKREKSAIKEPEEDTRSRLRKIPEEESKNDEILKDDEPEQGIPEDLFDYLNAKASILKYKFSKEDYTGKVKRMNFDLSAKMIPLKEIEKQYDECLQNFPEFKKVAEQYPKKSKREILKMFVRATILRHVALAEKKEEEHPNSFINGYEEHVNLTKKENREERKKEKAEKKKKASQKDITKFVLKPEKEEKRSTLFKLSPLKEKRRSISKMPSSPPTEFTNESQSPKAKRKRFVVKKSPQEIEETKGTGLKKRRRRIVGCGMGVNEYNKSKETVMKKIINGKYIDLNKLKNNIICIRYCKTRALIPSVKVQHINNDVKEIIDDIINDKFEKRLYEKLDVNDKRLIKRIVDALKLDIDLKDKTDEEYQRQFEIVLGEYRAGSTSPLIKHKLKQYIMESLESGMIPRRQAFSLLFELANS